MRASKSPRMALMRGTRQQSNMVIQSIKSTYTPIPSEEDVTPVDSSLVKIKKRLAKHFKTAAIIIVVVIICWVWFSYAYHAAEEVRIYCTSLQREGGLHVLTPKDMHEGLAELSSLKFGNCLSSMCGNVDFAHTGAISIDSTIRHQHILGFGGAFTESTAHNFFKLPVAQRARVIDLYFGEGGIGLSMGRIHINSCDFSLASYDFDSVPGDYDLEFFDNDVTHDSLEIIPLLLEATAKSQDPIRLVASPWSPPAWMKTPIHGNQSMLGTADQCLLPDRRVHLAWARYMSRFVEAYKRKGIPIWAITPQNEPEFAAPWEACSFNLSTEQAFINDYLGPVMRTDHPELRILAFDHNKDHLRKWAEELLRGDRGDFIDGMAFHWYGGEDRLTDGTYGYNNVNATHFLAPHKLLLGTEACSCPGVRIGDWLRAERLGHDVLFDLVNYAQGWLDWNLLVDSKGGPNHLGNVCDAALIASSDFSAVQIQPKFYYLGHFSKFVRPGSVRVKTSAVGNYNFMATDPNIQAGVELGMFACEKSPRQVWYIDPEIRTVQLRSSAVGPWSDDKDPIALCAAHGDANRNYFRLSDCSDSRQHLLKVHFQSETHQLVDLDSGLCISLAADVRAPGGLLELTPCATPVEDRQRFVYHVASGEITSMANEFCVTAGWPFLNAVGFSDPVGRTVVVLTNEAPIATVIELRDAALEDPLLLSAPARSILTVVYP